MKEIVARRFAAADLAEGRFINVNDGEKSTFDHDTRWSDPRDVPGENYGVYADADDQLVILDVDDHTGGDKDVSRRGLVGLGLLPSTLRFTSPHTEGADDKPDGHNVYRLAGDETPAELFKREFGKANPVPTWGEVIAKNKFIVGAGSKLDGCNKDWCDDCATAEGGRYVVKDDREIATVDPEALVEALSADPNLGEPASRENQTLDGATDTSPGDGGETPEYDDLARETVEGMLEEIPGSQHFDDWIRTAYAVYDWDDSNTGKEVFEEWSRTNQKWEEEESQRQIDYIWNNGEDGSANSKASVGTLVYLAKENGWSGSNATPTEPKNGRKTSWSNVRSLFENSDVDDRRARRAAAVALLDRHDFLYIDTEDRLLKYHEPTGVFEPGGARDAKKILVRELGGLFSTHDRNEIIATIQDMKAVDVETLNAEEFDRKLRCLENGVLDLETRELLDHSPEYRFTQTVPVEYDPDAEAPNAEAFLESITRTEGEKKTLEEMMGAALHPDYLKSKFLFLFGEGQNGKGVYFELLSHLLGTENVEGRGLHELANERFAKADLHGKLANIGGDIDDRKLKNVGELKRLTSNTDPVTAERKYGQPFKFTNSATLFFAANEPPAIEDKKRSMARRIVPMHMAIEFVEHPDPDDPHQKQAVDEEKLLADMTTDEELSGLLNLALEGMTRLVEKGDVSLEMDPMERLEYYQRFSDPIYRFAAECLNKTHGESVDKADVYEVYKEFSRAEGHGVRHSSVFWREFKRVFHFEQRRPRGPDGNKQPRELVDTELTETALEAYAPAKLKEKYGSVTADSDDSDKETATFDDLGAGFNDVGGVTVAEILDPPEWLQGKGHVVDEEGTILPYECEGADPLADVHEGDTVALQNVKVEDRKAGLTLVLSGVTRVENQTRAAGQSGLDSADTVADGGTETADTDGITEVYGSVKEHVRTEYDTGDRVTPAAVAGELYDLPRDQVESALKRMKKECRDPGLTPVGDGYEVV